MAAILAVLKFIGILLLILLGLVLFLAAIVLFVPVRYIVTCQYVQKQQFAVSVSWLWKILVLRRDFQEEEFKFYIFGINVQNIKEFFRRDKKKEEEEPVVPPDESRIHVVDEFYQKPDTQDSSVQIETDYSDKVKEETSEKKEKKQRKKSFSFDKISSIITFIRDDKNKAGFRKIKKELMDLLRYVMPDYVQGKVVFGTGDPCTTGWILGGISMFPLAYTEGLRIVPDFEEKILKADGFLKGKLRVIYLVKLLIRGYLDEDIKRLVMKVMEFI